MPYVHAHQGIHRVADEDHPHGETLVHSHLTPHSHDHDESEDAPDSDSTDEDRIWSVAMFVAQQPAPVSTNVFLVVAFAASQDPVETQRLLVDRDRPRAHAPPLVHSPSLRAPPAVLPIFI